MADNGGLTWRCGRPFNCSRCRVCLDLGIEGFVEVLEGSWCCVRLDLSVDGFIEVLGGSLCRVCLDLGVEGLVEALWGSSSVLHLPHYHARDVMEITERPHMVISHLGQWKLP